MYEAGDGVVQNFITAHMSFNIAAANGHTRSRELRDSLAQNMTPADVSEAQRRARVCVDSGYQDCGW
ncbi:SEL1-like repeat protein [Rhodosalinus sp. 5P4]|uniref:SEL1-like repeat protein n=1 Tax=Rhodosalinus sp. 5P4 TaxID=3239196 RepID=UPI0035232B50